MKIRNVFIFIFFLQWVCVYGQLIPGLPQSSGYNGTGYRYFSFRTPRAPLDSKKALTCYLNKSWNKSLISVSDLEKMELKYPAKYNLLDNQIEIIAPDGIRALSAKMISSLKWTDSISGINSYFINGKTFIKRGNPIVELMEILDDGAQPLLKRKFAQLNQVDKSVASIKPSTDELIVATEYYIVENKNIFKIKNERNLLNHLEMNKGDVKAFIKNEKLSVKKEADLIKVMQFYNSQRNGSAREGIKPNRS